MALYEVVFIARQDLSVEDVDALSDKFSKIIAEYKGKVVSTEYWGLRNLAYKINKNSRGHYIMLNVDAAHDAIKELQRVIGFNENIIRSQILAVKEHKNPSKLKVAKDARDFKAGKTTEAAPLLYDFDKLVINNLI
jgi:small subunit ribosomal protein S6